MSKKLAKSAKKPLVTYSKIECPEDFYASADMLYCKLWQPNVDWIHKNTCLKKGIQKT